MSAMKELLRRRGIENSANYLEDVFDTKGGGDLEFAERGDIEVHGSIHLMTRRTISRDEVETRLAKLKHV